MFCLFLSGCLNTGFTVYSNAQQNTLSMEADTVNPDITARKGKDQSDLGPYCLQFRLAGERADNNNQLLS